MMMNTINDPTPQVVATPKGIDDLQQIDWILEDVEVPLAEAIKVLSYPELYGLYDAKIQGRALEKLRLEIEKVEHCVRQARGGTAIDERDNSNLRLRPRPWAAVKS
jgi:hypothetical protein